MKGGKNQGDNVLHFQWQTEQALESRPEKRWRDLMFLALYLSLRFQDKHKGVQEEETELASKLGSVPCRRCLRAEYGWT